MDDPGRLDSTLCFAKAHPSADLVPRHSRFDSVLRLAASPRNRLTFSLRTFLTVVQVGLPAMEIQSQAAAHWVHAMVQGL